MIWGHVEAPEAPPMPFPRCGARNRNGSPCQASGAGVGGRCPNHGGMAVPGTLVLFSGADDWTAELFFSRAEQRRWRMMALPQDLFDLLGTAMLLWADDAAHVSWLLTERGVRRDRARRWPQQLGYRVVLKLAQRGRIAFGVFDDELAVKRAARRRLSLQERRRFAAVTVEGAEILRCLLATGTRLE